MRLHAALTRAMQAAHASWPDAHLRAVSGHGLRPDGSLDDADGLWFFLFSTAEGSRAVTWRAGEFHAVEATPVPAMLVPDDDIDVQRVQCSRALAEHFCGHAGWDGLAGRPEDSLWVGSRTGQVVAVVSGRGGATAVLDAYEPDRVVAMDFEPVAMRGETV